MQIEIENNDLEEYYRYHVLILDTYYELRLPKRHKQVLVELYSRYGKYLKQGKEVSEVNGLVFSRVSRKEMMRKLNCDKPVFNNILTSLRKRSVKGSEPFLLRQAINLEYFELPSTITIQINTDDGTNKSDNTNSD